MRHLVTTFICVAGAIGFTQTAGAQDMSPTLLIETGPNENPQYRRVIFVKYLSGNRVTANFRADNKTEFMRIDTTTPQELVDSCARGQATSLGEIQAFARDEAARNRSRQTPETRTFCIKNIPYWSSRNRDAYLDPIFETLPVSIQGL